MTGNNVYYAQGVALAGLESIIEDTKGLLRRLTTIRVDDALGRMLTYFIYKQLDHAMSVHKISPSMDVVLMARTMLDGLINISWVLEAPEERVKDWFDFTAVDNFELLQRKFENKVEVSQEDQKEIQEAYDAVKERFLKPNSNRHYDNFRRGKSLKSIAEGNPVLKNLYKGSYKYFSDWAHWGSQSLHHAVIQTPNVISYYEDDHSYLIPAVIAARHSLYETAMVANTHFRLDYEGILKANYESHDVEISKIL